MRTIATHPTGLVSAFLLAPIATLALAMPALAQGPIRVTTSGRDSGNGSDWTTNAANLQPALSIANAGDEIWVATGVYTPGTNRSDSLDLVPGVAVYGGFAGGETVRSQRNYATNPTALSGDVESNRIVSIGTISFRMV